MEDSPRHDAKEGLKVKKKKKKTCLHQSIRGATSDLPLAGSQSSNTRTIPRKKHAKTTRVRASSAFKGLLLGVLQSKSMKKRGCHTH